MKLTDLDFSTVRLLSIEDTKIKAVVDANVILEFRFQSHEELSRAFARWLGANNDITPFQIGSTQEWDFRSRFEN